MISVQEADKIIEQSLDPFPVERVPLDQAAGRVLREDLYADRDAPPFDKAAMDGIAVCHASWEQGTRTFFVEGIQKAGSPALVLKNKNNCIEIMTGAPLPSGCDSIVPVESLRHADGYARIDEEFKVARGRNVHERAADYKKGDLLAKAGCRLLSPQIAVAAAVGKAEVLVSRTPLIAVIGTGDELVGLDQEPAPYQIRQSNSYTIQSALHLHGYVKTRRFHLRDEKEVLLETLSKILKDFEVLILSGGVSMGKYDYVPEVLTRLGVEVLFHKVKQRPGKPFWFGKSREGKAVFALPGNPVSTHVSAYRYILPHLNRALGLMNPSVELIALNEDVENKTPFTYFLPVAVLYDQGARPVARPVFTHGSGDYASLVKSDGFVELGGQGRRDFPMGTIVPFYRW